jgi:hypothetical protein
MKSAATMARWMWRAVVALHGRYSCKRALETRAKTLGLKWSGPSGAGVSDGLWGQTGQKGANILHIRGGKVTKLAVYFELERALADVGLAPEADAADSP